MPPDLCDALQSTLGHVFTLERELPGGGMNLLFVATETALGRRVAIKVLPPDLANALDPRYEPITRHARFSALRKALHLEDVPRGPALNQR